MKRNWAILVACIVIAMIAAIALWKTFPSRWEASATIQIGQMPVGVPTLIESPAQAAERMTQRETEDKVLTSVGLSLDEETNIHTNLLRKSLKAQVVRNTNFIQISVAAFSPDDAIRYLNASAQTLIALHDQRMTPVVKNLQSRITTNERQMAEVKIERNRLEITLKNSPVSKGENHFAPSVIAINLLSKADDQIRALTAEHAVLTDLITPTNTYPTALINSAFVPEKPYFPKLSMFLAAGLLVGIAIGILLAQRQDRKYEKTEI